MATILSQVGWRTGVLNGGYKTWRREVVAALHYGETPLRLILIDGQTGTAKSEILARLAAHGAQTLDLETLASHRGSVFGGYQDRPQPSQKGFESALWVKLRALDFRLPIYVEAESNRIGRCELPPLIWRSMMTAPCITIAADIDARAAYLVEAYADIICNHGAIHQAINRLASFQSKETIAKWRALLDDGDYQALAALLMTDHYDALYDRARQRRADRQLAEIRLDQFNGEAFAQAASEILTRVRC
jgi:tRNA 2-selenouridine synthase